MSSSRPTKRWSAIRKCLDTFDRAGLLRLIEDLYRADANNRRFLESRLVGGAGVIEEYRRRVVDAVYPDPFSRRPISIRDASTAIAQYTKATGDHVGTTDLLLSFVEAGTEQAVDLGYGDEGYFAALERNLDAIDDAFDDLPEDVRAMFLSRLNRLRERAQHVGWGYGDYVADAVNASRHGLRRRLDAPLAGADEWGEKTASGVRSRGAEYRLPYYGATRGEPWKAARKSPTG
jgi:hypothetical protein